MSGERIVFGQMSPPPRTCLTGCKQPRWRRYHGEWVCLSCWKGNPMVLDHGDGPEGKTCRQCAHLISKRRDKVYIKCELRSMASSAQSDHRVGYPACGKFEQEQEEESNGR